MIDPIIKKNLWPEQVNLKQVTTPDGRWYEDSDGNKYYSVSTINSYKDPFNPYFWWLKLGRDALEEEGKDFDKDLALQIGEELGEEIKVTAAKEGSRMHELIEQFLFSGYEIPEKETGRGYQLFKQYLNNFLIGTHVVPHLIEVKLAHLEDGYGYAGTVDCVATIESHKYDKPKLAIIDHKSIRKIETCSKRLKKYKKQLAAYLVAVESIYGVEIDIGILNFASARSFKSYEFTRDEILESYQEFKEDVEYFYNNGGPESIS